MLFVDSVRRIVLQATSSLKSPAFWPEPPGAYPVGVAKWEAMSTVIECPEDSPDFKLFEKRFEALGGPRFQKVLNEEDSLNEEEDDDEELSDVPSEDNFSESTAMTNVDRQAILALKVPHVQLTNLEKASVAVGRSGSGDTRSTSTIEPETPFSPPALRTPVTPGSSLEGYEEIYIDYETGGNATRKENDEELEICADDSDCNEEERQNLVAKYGGAPAPIKISARMDVAGAAIAIDEAEYLAIEEVDKHERLLEEQHPWIKIEDGMEYYNESADRFARMGMVAQAAYSLATLNTINTEYERVIVECMSRQERNKKLMRGLEKARKAAIENDRMYSRARSGYRKIAKKLAASKKASIAQATKPMPTYLTTTTEAKKRKVEETSVFGPKLVTKKIRKSIPLADSSNTLSTEPERLREVVTNPPLGGVGEMPETRGTITLYASTENMSEEADGVVLEE